MKKFLSIFLVLTMFLSMASLSFASESSDTYEVIEKYDLKVVDHEEIPDHVKPIVVETEEELANLLDSIKKSKTIATIDEKDTPKMMRSSYIYDDIHAYVNYNLLWKHNLYATVQLTSDEESILGVEGITTSATGITIGVDYKPDPQASTFRLSSNKKNLTVIGGGTIDYYIFFEGIGTLYSEYDRITAEYVAGEGLVGVTHRKE